MILVFLESVIILILVKKLNITMSLIGLILVFLVFNMSFES